jgi:hypothetical protein
MRSMLQRSVQAFVVTMCLAGVAVAQEPAGRQPTTGEEPRESWYYQGPVYRADARAIVQQKAQARALQRQARLASLAWYGMSNSRPTAAPTPFTSLYSPVWQQPGGRPFAWYASNRPTYIFYSR